MKNHPPMRQLPQPSWWAWRAGRARPSVVHVSEACDPRRLTWQVTLCRVPSNSCEGVWRRDS